MKKAIIALTAIVILIGLVVVGGGNNSQQVEGASTNYNHIQEQAVTAEHDSPVIKDTLSQVERAIVK